MGFIPDRWLDYSCCGKPIKGVPIVAFKTPLANRYNRQRHHKDGGTYLEEDQQFTPEQLCKQIEELGYQLAVVIDLTFTFRYYNGANELEEYHGVQYKKVKCEGQRVPSDQVSDRVSEIMNDVIYQHGRDGKQLVGIHCTHGVNRTGYLVCRYMIEWLGFTPEKAIEAFNEARGHNLEREGYLEDLMKRTPKTQFDEYKKERDKKENEEDKNEWNEDINDFEHFTEPKTIANNRYESRWEPPPDRQDDEYSNNYRNRPYRGKFHRDDRYYRDDRRSCNSWHNRNKPYYRNRDDERKFYEDDLPTGDKFISGPSNADQLHENNS